MNIKAILFFAIFFVASTSFSSAINIYDCQPLDIEGQIYVLQNDILAADNLCFEIKADNITLNLNNYILQGRDKGVGIYDNAQDSIIIKNGIIKNFEKGVIIENLNNLVLDNLKILNNLEDGVYVENSEKITIRENYVANNLGSGGIYLKEVKNSIIENNTIIQNKYSGISLDYNSDNNKILNNYFDSGGNSINVWVEDSKNNIINSNRIQNGKIGIVIAGKKSENNTIKNNYIKENLYYGIVISNSVSNLIYNNYFNNTNNFFHLTKNEFALWFTVKQKGPNIVGGDFIGGNYWASPEGTGFSEICEDKNKDGFCDKSYILKKSNDNIDKLPLAKI